MQRAVAQFEQKFEKRYGIGLNEGMVICSVFKAGSLTSSEISALLGLTLSNTSKVIRSVENKGYLERSMGEKDKRQMIFKVTPLGEALMGTIKCNDEDLTQELSVIL